MLDHGDEKEARAERVTRIHELVPARVREDVFDARRYVEVANLVPPAEKRVP